MLTFPQFTTSLPSFCFLSNFLIIITLLSFRLLLTYALYILCLATLVKVTGTPCIDGIGTTHRRLSQATHDPHCTYSCTDGSMVIVSLGGDQVHHASIIIHCLNHQNFHQPVSPSNHAFMTIGKCNSNTLCHVCSRPSIATVLSNLQSRQSRDSQYSYSRVCRIFGGVVLQTIYLKWMVLNESMKHPKSDFHLIACLYFRSSPLLK